MPRGIQLAFSLICIPFFFLYGCNKSPDRKHPLPKIKACENCNIVFILIDTLRADHLPMYGYADTAPYMNSIAKRGTVFRNAIAPSSWTAPATASIFTGMHSSQHGVITGFAATKLMQKQQAAIQLNRIPSNIKTMGEIMAEAGFHTIAVTDNLNIGHEMGFDRGFADFKQFRNAGAQKVSRTAADFITASSDKAPYFLYLHYMDPHSPYRKHNPYYSECAAGLSQDKQALTRCAYDSEIRYVDQAIAELASKFNWLENALLVVTADHGEEFWEHGGTGHGHSLYNEVIRVPLIMYHPALNANEIWENVQTIDALPTLVSLLSLEADKRWRGRSLESFLYGKGSELKDREIVSERFGRKELPGPEFRSLTLRNLHFIETSSLEDQKVLKKELFDTHKDYAEKNNLYSSENPLEKRLSSIPRRAPVSEDKSEASVTVDPQLMKQLKSLGYIN